MNKIAVLIPPYFWSSIPYDGLTLYDHLNGIMDVDLIMFGDDIRLNKKFSGNEKYKFKKDLFIGSNPVIVNNWSNFYTLAKDYNYVVTGVHMMPKPRRQLMGSIPPDIKSKIIMTDIGGMDIITNEAFDYSDRFMVKGNVWKEWMNLMGHEQVYVTGCPQYDYYLHSDLMSVKESRMLNKKDFFEKYRLHLDKKILLIMPSNPSCHVDQFNTNMKEMEKVGKMAEDNGYQILVKTYPHDYVFYDEERNYNGVYRRLFNRLTPQYKVLESHISNAIVVDSQDHFSAISFSDVLFNMSGSHVAWETYFTKTQSFSMNYVKQIYYGGTKYIPSYITLPDGIVNIEVSDSGELFSGATRSHDGMENYISKDFSLSNIAKEIKHIMEK